MMYVEIGKTFELYGHKLTCVEGRGCEDCAFNIQKNTPFCDRFMCSRYTRKDCKDVKFLTDEKPIPDFIYWQKVAEKKKKL